MSEQRRLKIVFVHHGKGLGGAPLSLLYLIQGIPKDCYDVSVVFLHDSEVINLYKKHGITCIGPTQTYDFPHTKIWWLRWYHITMIGRVVWDFFKTWLIVAPKILDQIKPDIIHLNTSSLSAWALAAHTKKIPVVWHIREPLASGYTGLRRWITKKIISSYATKIIAISHADAAPWDTLEKTQVIENFAPATIYHNTVMEKPQSKKVILYVGGMSQEKGIDFLLDVMEKIIKQRSDVRLIIAGNMPPIKQKVLYAPHESFAKKVWSKIDKLHQHIHIVGLTDAIPELMRSADIIVFPAQVGHFARPIIEAGMMEKPVIASDLKPLDELVQDKKTGFLVSASDSSAWVAKLCLILDNKALAETMGACAYDFCKEKFDTQKQILKFLAVYKNVSSKENMQ